MVIVRLWLDKSPRRLWQDRFLPSLPADGCRRVSITASHLDWLLRPRLRVFRQYRVSQTFLDHWQTEACCHVHGNVHGQAGGGEVRSAGVCAAVMREGEERLGWEGPLREGEREGEREGGNITPKQYVIHLTSWLCNKLFIFKTSLFSLWKDKWLVK